MQTHVDRDKEKYSIDKCIEELKTGLFGAVEWIGPHDDIELGLPDAAEFYHYLGWWEPGTTFDVQVNRDAWRELPKHYQKIFKFACFETHLEILAEYNQKNTTALKSLPKNVKLIEFSDEIIKRAKVETDNLLKSYATDPIFNEVYREWLNFREQITWINNIDTIRAKKS